MFQKVIALFLISVFLHLPLQAQSLKERGFLKELQISYFNNAIALPFSGKLGIFHSPAHPGLRVGTNFRWNKNEKHLLSQNAHFGLFYQQFVQTGVQLYSSFQYAYRFGFGLETGANLGFGYLHTFPDLERFRLDADGNYQKIRNWGRMGVMIPLGFQIQYDFRKHKLPLKLFTEYQIWFQTPFSKAYIPVLPNTSLHIGTTWFLNKEQ